MNTIIGIAGTAKNTGKTTTLNALLKQSPLRNASVGITGIGYDGEDIDTITGLPKPRVLVHEGMLVSTSHRCIPSSGWTIVERTPLSSALGDIVIARCDARSTIVIAGPKKRSDLRIVTQKMIAAGCSTIFVDGALNRIAPMSIADRLIFTTGAARTVDIPSLVTETAAIEQIFRIPVTSNPVQKNPPLSVIHTDRDAEHAIRMGTRGTELALRGVLSAVGLEGLLRVVTNTADTNIASIVFDDPMQLLLGGEPVRTARCLESLRSLGIGISFSRSVALSAITVNPFYPEYSGTTYAEKYVDARSLLSHMESAVAIPVFDMNVTGADRLWRTLLPSSD